MRFHVVTIFPEIFSSFLGRCIGARALKKRILSVRFFNPRDFTVNKHKKIDDRPYGGGPGMVMMAEPILKSVEQIKKNRKLQAKSYKLIILSPRGKKFTNIYARNLTKRYSDIILICGRYEGIDARVKKILRAEKISMGNYVLSGGEVPAMAVIEATARQLPGFLGKAESLEESRTASGEVFTRPEVLKWPPPGRGKKGKNYKVPKVLLSGHHDKISSWRSKR